MKGDPVPIQPAKSPRERFMELGKKIMSASKDEVDAQDKKWRGRKKRRPKR